MEETNPKEILAEEPIEKEVQPKATKTYNEQIKIPTSSRYLFTLRIILLIFTCVFIPMYSIISPRLDNIEQTKFFPVIHKYIPRTFTYTSNYFYVFSTCTMFIFLDKFMICFVLGFVYIGIDPFISLKTIVAVSIVDYFFATIKLLYLEKRPFWLDNDSQARFCYADYASPSEKIFIQTFFYIYLTIQIANRRAKPINLFYKFLLVVTYLILVTVNIGVLLGHRLFYLHQIAFSTTLSLVILSIILDFDGSYDHLLHKATKNIFKIRKYKIKVFFLVLGFFTFGLMLYYFSSEDDLNEVEMVIYKNNNCGTQEKEEIGKKNTIKQSTYIFSLLGAFWGASFTVENGIGQWWNVSLRNFLIKFGIFCALLFGIILFFWIIPYFTFEFDFCLTCAKYYIIYYGIFGLMPLFFDKLRLNHIVGNMSFGKEKNKLFSQSIFTGTDNIIETIVDDFVVFSKEDEINQINKKQDEYKPIGPNIDENQNAQIIPVNQQIVAQPEQVNQQPTEQNNNQEEAHIAQGEQINQQPQEGYVVPEQNNNEGYEQQQQINQDYQPIENQVEGQQNNQYYQQVSNPVEEQQNNYTQEGYYQPNPEQQNNYAQEGFNNANEEQQISNEPQNYEN